MKVEVTRVPATIKAQAAIQTDVDKLQTDQLDTAQTVNDIDTRLKEVEKPEAIE